MDDKINDAVVKATQNVFGRMLKCDVSAKAARPKEGQHPEFEVTGIVALTGRTQGMVALSVSRDIANRAGMTLVGEPPENENELTDIVAELTNMVAGNAKANLSEYGMSMSIPTVVSGNGVVSCGSSLSPVVIPLDSPWGEFCVEVALAGS